VTIEATPIAMALVGAGPEADRWARALRGTDHVVLDRIDGGEDAFLATLSREGVDAMAFVAPIPDLAGAIKRAVLAGRHVLIAGPEMLSSRQLLALEALARRRRRAIVLDGETLGDEQLAFVRKMTSGANALWRPRYLRALRTSVAEDASLDALALTEIRRVIAVAGGLPATVSALSPRVDDETGAADVAMVTLSFDAGPVARIDVSLLEPAMQQELVVACDARTIVLRPLDREAPLRIAAGGHRGPKAGAPWAETIHEHPAGEVLDRITIAAERFIAAVRARDVAATNLDEAAQAALVWECARTSMARGGDPVVVAEGEFRAGRPVLNVIQGGGQTTASGETPRLTLVGRG
jgi:predicted dehydrogenase